MMRYLFAPAGGGDSLNILDLGAQVTFLGVKFVKEVFFRVSHFYGYRFGLLEFWITFFGS